ncbi:YbaB/EbfC family nucleoid-associated protein [Glycomyces arizonensis]|uniref:YbaB/EbfC family nucleoid-associated protein n=1 Tax=Glycomyces arizonensis TaxID=256035 RepID=UPI00040CCD84|nr:YbaB/EbfC family nucleoid-associated protein [Glycomyces arizonensis]
MDFPPIDPASARARLADWKERTDRMAEDTQALAAQVQTLKVTATDRDELAEVTVDHTGSPVDLVFSARIKRVSEEAAARAVLEAIRAAKIKLAERSQELVESTVGAESPAGRAFVSGLRRQFGDDAEQGGER